MRLYLGFLGKIPTFLRCRICKFTQLIHDNKLFERAKAQLDKACDIFEIADISRRSKNYLRNALSHKQRILLKFDNGNVIRANDSGSDEALENEDIDE